MKSRLWLHPFLFAVVPLFALFVHNRSQLTWSELPVPALAVLAAAALTYLLLAGVFRSVSKGAVSTSLLLILFFTYGHVFRAVAGLTLNGSLVGRHKVLLVAWAALAGVVLLLAAFRGKSEGLNRWLQSTALFALLITGSNAAWQSFQIQGMRAAAPHGRSVAGDAAVNPDIYYIVLDGYAAADTLNRHFDYDNQPFLDALRARGFIVPERVWSNYAMSNLSLASSLNMNYVFPGGHKDLYRLGNSREERALIEWIEDNAVWRYLDARGYAFIHFSSGWGGTLKNKYADVNFRPGFFNEFTRVLLQTSVLRPFQARFITKDHRKAVLYTFEKLAQVALMPKPTFTFAHIVSPHPPYLFDAQGGPVDLPPDAPEDEAGWPARHRYVAQLQYVNTRVLAMVDEILRRTPDAVVLLQADHGPASTWNADNLNTNAYGEEQVEERTRIFAAVRTGRPPAEAWRHSITPVNFFRLVFNDLFGAGFETHENATLFSSYSTPQDFRRIDRGPRMALLPEAP